MLIYSQTIVEIPVITQISSLFSPACRALEVSCGPPALMKTYKRKVQGNNACRRCFSTWKGTAGC